MSTRTDMWEHFTGEEQEQLRQALRARRQKQIVTEPQLSLLRKYWRIQKQRAAGGVQRDARINTEYRDWLVRNGLSLQWNPKYWNRWVAEGRP